MYLDIYLWKCMLHVEISSPRMYLLLFSCSLMSNSLQTQELQHVRLPCPSPSPEACSDSFLLSQWCHATILFSVIPYSSCLQSFLASGSFLMSWLFTWSGQSFGASASVLPVNIQSWFPLGFTGSMSLLSKGLSKIFSSTTFGKHQFVGSQPSLWSSSYIHSMTTGKTNSLATELKKPKFNIHNPRGLVPPAVQPYAAEYRGTMCWVGRLPFGMEPISRNPLFQVFPSWSSCLDVLLLFKVLHTY